MVPPTEEDDPAEWKVFLGVLRERFETDKDKAGPRSPSRSRGVTEETTTGVLRLYQFAAAGELTASRRSTSTTR